MNTRGLGIKLTKQKNKTETVKVEIALEGDILRMLREAAEVNGMTVTEATQFLIDFADGSICDWSNEGYPTNGSDRLAYRQCLPAWAR